MNPNIDQVVDLGAKVGAPDNQGVYWAIGTTGTGLVFVDKDKGIHPLAMVPQLVSAKRFVQFVLVPPPEVCIALERLHRQAAEGHGLPHPVDGGGDPTEGRAQEVPGVRPDDPGAAPDARDHAVRAPGGPAPAVAEDATLGAEGRDV